MGNNTCVIYTSKYGSTKKYGEWIADELKADLFEAKSINVNKILQYDTIIYGGSLYARGILGINLIKDNYEKIKEKNIIIYIVGASSNKMAEENIDSIISYNLSEEIRKKIKYFYLRGGFNYNILSLKDKFLMNLLKVKLKRIKEEDRTEEEQGMLDAYDNPINFVNRNNIKELLLAI